LVGAGEGECVRWGDAGGGGGEGRGGIGCGGVEERRSGVREGFDGEAGGRPLADVLRGASRPLPGFRGDRSKSCDLNPLDVKGMKWGERLTEALGWPNEVRKVIFLHLYSRLFRFSSRRS